MNCWDLLQNYLSTNIFKNPSASLLSPTSTVTSTSQGEKGQSNRPAKSKQHNGALKNSHVSNSSSKKSSRLHLNETSVNNRRVSSSAHSEKEKHRAKTGTQFSTPKLPLSVNLGGKVRKEVPSSSKGGTTKVQCLFKQKSIDDDCHHVVISSPSAHTPSASPLLSSCDSLSLSSSQSDCSISVEETFRLYLDSDDESIVSGEGPLSCVQRISPKHVCSLPPQKQVNGYKNSHLNQHLNSAKSTPKRLPNGQSRRGKVLVKTMKKDIITRNQPSSTTHSSADNSSDSDSWSKRRLRKRPCSSSPAPSLESTKLGMCSSSSGGHDEVSSTTSPLLQTMTSPPLTSAPISHPPITAAIDVNSKSLLPQRRSPNPEYQQELLEWQFLLNKECRPMEAFILVENRIDEASIPWAFKYITSNVYGEGVPDPSKVSMKGPKCGCTCYIMGKRCGPKNEHCCPQMGGAEFPYSPAGKVRLPPGNPIYECNGHCSCPHDCTNRVVQHGRKINMCIFRTSNGRGWGVKTMEPIKPNTFVTEYVGEVVTTEEAERRGQLYDKEGRTYLFDLDFSCDDNAFTIDAAHYGNISHFFNHSVSLNSM